MMLPVCEPDVSPAATSAGLATARVPQTCHRPCLRPNPDIRPVVGRITLPHSQARTRNFTYTANGHTQAPLAAGAKGDCPEINSSRQFQKKNYLHAWTLHRSIPRRVPAGGSKPGGYGPPHRTSSDLVWAVAFAQRRGAAPCLCSLTDSGRTYAQIPDEVSIVTQAALRAQTHAKQAALDPGPRDPG